MSRYKKRVDYRPNKIEIKSYQYCLRRGVAYVLEKNTKGSFYIKRLYLNKELQSEKDKRDSYLRIDKNKTDRKANRLTFNESDGWKEVFRLYKLTKESI